MNRHYYFKATLDGGKSGYDHKYIHKLGHNEHPSPNRKSKEVCGIGVHLARTLTDAKSYVSGATEFYLCTSDDIIAKDDTKVRVGCYEVLCRIPQRLISKHQPKWDALNNEWQSKWDALNRVFLRDILEDMKKSQLKVKK